MMPVACLRSSAKSWPARSVSTGSEPFTIISKSRASSTCLQDLKYSVRKPSSVGFLASCSAHAMISPELASNIVLQKCRHI